MNELGRISTSIPDAAKAGYPANVKTGSSPTTASIKIADNDAAAASLRSAYREEAADACQVTSNSDGPDIWPLTMTEFVIAVREKIARFLELLEQITNGHLMRGALAQNLAQMNAQFKPGAFLRPQAGQKTLKAHPFKNIDPKQVLFLLRNN